MFEFFNDSGNAEFAEQGMDFLARGGNDTELATLPFHELCPAVIAIDPVSVHIAHEAIISDWDPGHFRSVIGDATEAYTPAQLQ